MMAATDKPLPIQRVVQKYAYEGAALIYIVFALGLLLSTKLEYLEWRVAWLLGFWSIVALSLVSILISIACIVSVRISRVLSWKFAGYSFVANGVMYLVIDSLTDGRFNIRLDYIVFIIVMGLHLFLFISDLLMRSTKS